MIPSTIAPTTKSTAQTVVARDSTVAPLRAPNAAWLAAAAERVGDVAALALLEEHDQHQHEAGEHVKRCDEVVQHLKLPSGPQDRPYEDLNRWPYGKR